MRITDNGMQIFSPASSVMVDSHGLMASSEHSSIRGTINGGGDFVKNGNPPRLIQTPSADILMYGTRVAVDVGFNGATAVLVLEGKIKAKELVTGSEVEVNAGQAAVIIPGFAVGAALAVDKDKVNRWWEKSPTAPSMPVEIKEPQIALGNTFQESGFGYTVKYPGDWVYTKPSQYTVVFSGKEGTDAYYSTVSIQNIAPSKAGGKHQDVDSLVKSLKDQITTGTENGKISDEKAFDCSAEGEKLTAKGFKAEYARQGENFKQCVVVVQRADGKAFHIWSYTSPAVQYDTFLSTAQAILDSWAITK
jgi:hypothetical protein